jgi:hypothetical protein
MSTDVASVAVEALVAVVAVVAIDIAVDVEEVDDEAECFT